MTDTAAQEFLNRLARQNCPDLALPPIENKVVYVDLSPQELGLYRSAPGSDTEKLMMCNHHQITDMVRFLVVFFSCFACAFAALLTDY